MTCLLQNFSRKRLRDLAVVTFAHHDNTQCLKGICFVICDQPLFLRWLKQNFYSRKIVLGCTHQFDARNALERNWPYSQGHNSLNLQLPQTLVSAEAASASHSSFRALNVASMCAFSTCISIWRFA